RWFVDHYRLAASPGAAYALYRTMVETDIRDVLPAIRVPTLVLHSPALREPAQDLAHRVPEAECVQVPDESWWLVTNDFALAEVERFLVTGHTAPEPNRLLATVLFTDIVGSTEQATKLGDAAWQLLREQHDTLIRQQLARFRGEEMGTAGDSFFAIFDGPARAIRCAAAIQEKVQELGLEVRAGLHTGECEQASDGKVSGIAVHMAARVSAKAGPSEVLVSSTVRDLVAGSGIEFQD